MRPDKNLRHRRAEVKLVQVESSGRDLHDEVHCMTFLQQTQIQSDLLDEESRRGRKLQGDFSI